MVGIDGALGAFNAFAGLLGGGAPPVVLGPVSFAGLEVPQEIPWGGQQMLAVHKMPGGMRVINAMGRDDVDLIWSGYLEGPYATQRAIELDALRVSGLPQLLSWDALNYTVVVAEFHANYRRRNWIPYTIRCVVVQDNAAVFATQAPGLLTTINNDLNSVLQTVMPIASEVSQAVGVAQTALGVAGAMTKGSSAWVSALSDLDLAKGQIDNVVSSGNLTLQGATQSTLGILGESSAAGAISAIPGLIAGAGSLAGALQQNGYIGRAYTNLENASA